MYDGVITAKDTIHTDCVETKSQALEAQKWANGTEPKKLVYGDNVVVNPQYPIASGLQFKNNAKYYAEEAKKWVEGFPEGHENHGKSAREYSEKFDKFLEGASVDGDAAIDTLLEIQQFIGAEGEPAQKLIEKVEENATKIEELNQYKGEAENKFVSKDENGEVTIDTLYVKRANEEEFATDALINVGGELESLVEDIDSLWQYGNVLEDSINEIEEHLAPKYIITDDKTAYRKDVPANACSKAQLNSIGGMTYRDEATNTFVDAKVTELKSEGANNTVVDTLEIAEEIQAIEGYGCGMYDDYYNYIDYERKVFVQKTKRIVFNGTENWRVQSINSVGLANFEYKFTQKSTYMPTICSHYDADDSIIADATKEGVMNNPNILFVRSFAYQTVDEWKAHLAELYANGNPLVIEYALAEPIETDISAYIDNNIIKVTAGGAIEFVSDIKKAVPSSVSYMMGGHLLEKEV
jgi:hypothetical protein